MLIDPNRTADDAFESVVEEIHKLYNGRLTDIEARQAARNFIGFLEVFLDIKKRQVQNKP
jgi:hypothetical protein